MTSNAQRLVLRAGAALCILASLVLSGFAVQIDAHPKTTLTTATDPTRIELPKPGLFGGDVTVYAKGAARRATPEGLRCVLVSKSGREQSSAKMSSIALLMTRPKPATTDEFVPVFTVSNYPAGSRLECAKARNATLAVNNPTTFGAAAPLVKWSAGLFAVGAFTLGTGWLFMSRRREKS